MRLILSTSFVLLSVLLPARNASANIIYDVSGVNLFDVTTTHLTGTFTTNDARTQIISYDITAPSQVAGAFTFPGFEYTPSDSTVTSNGLPGNFRIDSPGGVDELQLVFSGNLSATGATIGSNAYEHESVAGNRTASGQVTLASGTAPEPSTIGLVGFGLIAGLAFARKKKRA